jgi:hypothetical protein
MSSNKRTQEEEDLYNTIAVSLKKSYDLLDTIHTLLRNTLEDSVASFESGASLFDDLSEPDQIDCVLQRMVKEGQNMTVELLENYTDTVISRASWDMCQKLHQAKTALFKGLVSLRKSLSTHSTDLNTLTEHMDKSEMITKDLDRFHRSIVDDNMYTKAQQAIINEQDEFSFTKFAQKSIDMASRDDHRGLLGLHSADMFLDGIQKAFINVTYTLVAKEVVRILEEELVVSSEVFLSYNALKRLKKAKKS